MGRKEGGNGGRQLDESFVTAVPGDMAVGRGTVSELPYDEAACKGCPRQGVCQRAHEHLPLVVRWILEPRREHKCRHGGVVVMCRAVPKRSTSVGEDEEPEVPSGTRSRRPKYVLDANIFLNAYNGHPDMGEACWWVLDTPRLRICTTQQVIDEAYNTKGNTFPLTLERVDVPLIEDRIMNLKPAEFMKDPSEADRSLMQAVLNDREIRGIVTFDPDFTNVAASGLLTAWTGRKVEVLNAFELRAKHS